VSSNVTVKHEHVLRILLVFMGIPSVLIGLWAGFAPRGFYDDFPGAGRSWVAPDGPFNEHLVRDVGVLNLALAVVTIAAVVWLTRPLPGPVTADVRAASGRPAAGRSRAASHGRAGRRRAGAAAGHESLCRHGRPRRRGTPVGLDGHGCDRYLVGR
jgi:hypothetical protein